MTEKQKEAFRKCGIPPEEWEAVIAADKEIDRGEKLFELPDELKAGAKKARQADRKTAERKPREKKVDSEKQTLLTLLYEAILPYCQSYEVINAEREFSFTRNGRKYKVVLSCPRSQAPKGSSPSAPFQRGVPESPSLAVCGRLATNC